jgi:hypothetical protein
MIAENFLLDQCKHRPVRKAVKRKKATDGIPSQNGESYLMTISTKLRSSVTELVDWLEVFQCVHWNSAYSDPWITLISIGRYD